MISFGNQELDESPPLHSGEAILCPTCGQSHVVKGGIDKHTGEETTLLFYKCGRTAYLAGIDGRNIMHRFMREED